MTVTAPSPTAPKAPHTRGFGVKRRYQLGTNLAAAPTSPDAPRLALVVVSLCAGVGVVAVGRLADRLVALDERAERSGQRRDCRREPAELQVVGERRCVPDVAVIDRLGDEGRATQDTEDEQARVEREDREPQSCGRGEVEEDDGLAVVLPGGPFP